MALLALLGGGLWWTASLDAQESRGNGDAAAGPFPVFVVGPDGLLANGTAFAPGTPYETLLALAQAQGFTVDSEQQAWIGGGCTSTYVVGIAGHRESATGGWNYYTRRAGSADWTWGSSGAACHRLAPGDEVEWCWVEADACRHHVP